MLKHVSFCFFPRYIDYDLALKMKQLGTDLIILEGMGRAIHTNFNAKFTCDTLKVAVLKNQWLARRLGGEMFSVVFKYEPCDLTYEPCSGDSKSNVKRNEQSDRVSSKS